MTPEAWMTKKDVARKLEISIRTVERLRLPCMRVGGQNRYLMSQVYAALNGVPIDADNVIALRRHPSGKAA